MLLSVTQQVFLEDLSLSRVMTRASTPNTNQPPLLKICRAQPAERGERLCTERGAEGGF